MINIINIFGIPFLFALIGSSLFIAIPLFILKLGVTDPFALGMAGVAFQICYMLFCVLHSLLSKHINRRRSIIVVSVIYPVIILGFILAHKISFIILLSALLGIALSMFWPTYETHITVNLDQCRATKNLQGFNIGWSSGSVLGCLLGGILFSINARLVFYFDFVISLIAIYFIFRYIQESSVPNTLPLTPPKGGEERDNLPHTPSPQGKGREKNAFLSPPPEGGKGRGGGAHNVRQFLIFGWIAAFAVWFCIGIIVWIFPKFAIDSGMSAPIIGFLRATLGMFQVIIFFILGLNHRWQYSFPYLAIYELILISGFVILIMTSTVAWWSLSFALIGISAGFVYSSSLFYSSQAKTEKSEKTGFHEAVVISGALFGTFFGGVIAKAFSATAAYSMCIGLMTFCIILQLFWWFRVTPPPTSSPINGED